ncbi:50S ribosomal protein L29 [Candidatus Shapirobacteria bacterium]|nr:50S ribosomal protein L29 [Candidatus Shapirobacteria bacterium]
MKKTDKISYRQKAPAELTKLLADSKKRLVETRAKQSTGNLKDTSVFKKIKYEINYILTLLTQNGK